MGFHQLDPQTQKIAFAASMFAVVSLIYVLGILAKPNFKVYESKYVINHHPLRAQSLRFKLLEGQP